MSRIDKLLAAAQHKTSADYGSYSKTTSPKLKFPTKFQKMRTTF